MRWKTVRSRRPHFSSIIIHWEFPARIKGISQNWTKNWTYPPPTLWGWNILWLKSLGLKFHTQWGLKLGVEMSYKRPTFKNIFLKLDHPNSYTVMDLWNSDTQALLNHNLFSISRLWRCDQSVLDWSAPEKSQGGASLSACAVHTDAFSKNIVWFR